jgi:uncharacterized protein
MSTPTNTIPAPRALSGLEEAVDRYAGIKQYSLGQIVAVWAAATLPMGVLAWIVAPALKDNFSGAGNVPMAKALLLVLTAGLIWQGVMVAGLVWIEQRSLRWSMLRQVLWLRSPRSPKSGRLGGKLWLIVIPLIIAYAAVGFLIPMPASPADRDFGKFLDSDPGQTFLSGNWLWFGLLLVLWVFNTVLGEELLFRGLLLPRMNRVFGRGDWLANGVLFAAYHVHVPWVMPETLLGDTLLLAYPTKRYQSAWIGIVVHSGQSVYLAAIVLWFVL